jgi:DNA-binding NarL/FixJ family response regulator
MEAKCKVIIVDDHDMFRSGVRVLLSKSQSVEIIAEARNGNEYLELLNQCKPHVVLMDISMPVMDGIEATRISTEKFPDIKILALSMYGDEEYYFKMVSAGAKGFVLKSSGISELEKAITEIADNNTYFSQELLQQIILSLSEKKQQAETNATGNLTKREQEVLLLISKGLSNDDIAEKLNISLATVKTHRSSLLSKTDCNNTASLVMYGIKHKLIEIN